MFVNNGDSPARRYGRSFLRAVLVLGLIFSSAGCMEKTVITSPGVISKGAKPAVPQEASSSGDSQVVRGATPYVVQGKTYKPLLSGDGYSEEGLASWYGPDFHGKETAGGERYNMYDMTAAHKVLPFGTMVRVTSLENGRSAVVRINDRGPFVGNRIIDLSKSAADQLNMAEKGTMLVRVESIGVVPGLRNGELQGKFYVQVGAFGKEDNAGGLSRALLDRGFKVRNYYSPQVNMWRVQVGPYDTLSAAVNQVESLRDEFVGSYIVAD
ncbi:MAG: septal ring lytic transglycosylase RlpA family protein [Deltaproteobacteria bacterium]|nr:septal ring lytic transglycosylase RlpA family protein [Deltaproteobacteria bacterium]